MRVLHIVPDSVSDARHLFLGSTKDVRGRTEYFRARGIAADEVLAVRRSDRLLLKKLRTLDLRPYTAAVIELPLYPRSIRFLRRTAPHVRVLVRAINAELFHDVHAILAWKAFDGWRPRTLRNGLFYTKFGLQRLLLDVLCSRLSHGILGITKWEAEHYWRYLAGSSRVSCVPYFLPESYSVSPASPTEKRNRCVCVMSSSPYISPFLLDSAKQFGALVSALGEGCPEWEFYMTGDCSEARLRLPARIIRTGFLDSPFEVVRGSRAVAVLSNYGFGFKTKVLDAIQQRCYVLVPSKLYERLPAEVQPHCIVVDLHSVDSFKEALRRCQQPFPDADPNQVLRAQAYATLDELLAA